MTNTSVFPITLLLIYMRMFSRYLQDHPYLICEKAANFLVIWCIDLEVDEVCRSGYLY